MTDVAMAPATESIAADERIQAVLRLYDARILEERGTAQAGIPTDGIDPRMRAVGPATGQLINLIARSLPAPVILELGTSYGYSAIWLAEAARATGGRLISIETHDYKTAHAREMAAKAGLDSHIDFRVGDALQLIADLEVTVDFVLVDLWKDLYLPCLEAFFPKLNPGAVIVADNMRPNNEAIRRYGQAVRAQPGITSLRLPIGSGVEVSRYEPQGPTYEPRPGSLAAESVPDRPGR
jgi:predicted O-methyltransferase YrrM